MSPRNLELFRFPFYVNYDGLGNFLMILQNPEVDILYTITRKSIKDKVLFNHMNGEYEMCACGHFRKDHAHGFAVTISNCGCGCPEFRKRN